MPKPNLVRVRAIQMHDSRLVGSIKQSLLRRLVLLHRVQKLSESVIDTVQVFLHELLVGFRLGQSLRNGEDIPDLPSTQLRLLLRDLPDPVLNLGFPVAVLVIQLVDVALPDISLLLQSQGLEVDGIVTPR